MRWPFSRRKQREASRRTLEIGEPVDEVFQAQSGEIVGWRKGYQFTAVDPVVLGMPSQAFDEQTPLEETLKASEDAEFGLNDDMPDICILRLKSGQWAQTSVSMQCYLWFDPETTGRIHLKGPVGPAD